MKVTFSKITAGAAGKGKFDILYGKHVWGVCHEVSNAGGKAQWRGAIVDTSARTDGRQYNDRVMYYQAESPATVRAFMTRYANNNQQVGWMLKSGATRKACRRSRFAFPSGQVVRWFK